MKTIKLLILIIATTISTTSFAQVHYLDNPNWGANSDEREANMLLFQIYKNAYTAKDYPAATGHLQELLTKAPKGSENIYIIGTLLYENKVVGATSLAEKKVSLDSLMYLYDKRIEIFGETSKIGVAAIKEIKAQAYHKHSPTDITGVQAMYLDAIEAAGDDVDLKLINHYFKLVTDGYAMDIVEVDQLLDNYNKLIVVFDSSSDTTATRQKALFESLFLNSGAANCDNIEMLFKDKIAQNPDSIELINKAFKLLSGMKCESEFYISVAEKLHKVTPSAEIAMLLAKTYQDKKDYVKAMQYLNQAAANESDPTAKANLYINLGGTELELKNYIGAVKYANMAIELSPNNPYSYIIIGSAYIQGSTACSDFKLKSVYWLAYDSFMTASHKLSAGDPQMTNVKEQIFACSENFPTTEECFFLGLNEGEEYTVECGWIKRSTTVRYRK